MPDPGDLGGPDWAPDRPVIYVGGRRIDTVDESRDADTQSSADEPAPARLNVAPVRPGPAIYVDGRLVEPAR